MEEQKAYGNVLGYTLNEHGVMIVKKRD